tara:strand:- start:166 stop:405 length:240 start_codon:yes stop_codon:yes gene_type:complete
MDKQKKPLINEVNKKVHCMHLRLDGIVKRLDNIDEDIAIIKKHVIETNYKVPERKAGWFYDTWSSPNKLSKEEFEKLQK